MMEINLIPLALRKNHNAETHSWGIALPKTLLWAVGSGVMVLVLAMHLILGAFGLVTSWQLSIAQSRLGQVVADKTVLDAIRGETADLKRQWHQIADITVNKIEPWAPRFNALADVLPAGLWIRKMIFDKTGLRIEGSVVSRTHNEMNIIEAFTSSLKSRRDFMGSWSGLELGAIKRAHIGLVEVTHFSLVVQ